MTSHSPQWPTFGLRYKAFLIDAGICLATFFLGGIAVAVFFEARPFGRVASFLVIILGILSYEPFMLSQYGSTLGHRALNIQPSGLDSSLAPSRIRRVTGIFVYGFLFFLLTTISWGVSASQECIELDICTISERQTLDLLTYGLLLGCGFSIVFGWTGRLPGFRRTTR